MPILTVPTLTLIILKSAQLKKFEIIYIKRIRFIRIFINFFIFPTEMTITRNQPQYEFLSTNFFYYHPLLSDLSHLLVSSSLDSFFGWSIRLYFRGKHTLPSIYCTINCFLIYFLICLGAYSVILTFESVLYRSEENELIE